jgi:hypothetical protein
MQRVLNLLRADEVNVAVKPACGQDLALACNGFGAGPDDDIDTGLGVGVARFADLGDAPVFKADISLVDAGVIDDQRIGDDGINRSACAGDLGLSHAIADDLAAAELDLFAIDRGIVPTALGLGRSNSKGGQVALYLDDQISVGKPDLVARCGAEHGGIVGAVDCGWHLKALP